MKTVHLLPYRLGNSTTEIVSPRQIEFYLWVAKIVMHDDCRLTYQSTKTTVPIDNKEIQSGSVSVLHQFTEHFQHITDPVNLVLVEVYNPVSVTVRTSVLIDLALAIRGAVRDHAPRQSGFLKFCILLPDLPSEEEDVYRLLRDEIERDDVIFIDFNGNSLRGTHIPTDLKRSYRARLTDARGDPREALKFKMLRRCGHFKKKGTPGVCWRHYFDGSLCGDEITWLIDDHIDNVYNHDSPSLILHEANPSYWLEGPLRAVALGRGLAEQCMSVDDAIRTGALARIKPGSVPPLIVTAMVDGGTTIGQAVDNIREANEGVTPRVLSILTTHQDIRDARRIRLLADIEVHYLLKVFRKSFQSSDCEMCKLKQRFSDASLAEPFLELTAYDMWNMVEEAGWTREQDKPFYRNQVLIVPDYLKIVGLNGTWLAKKIDWLLRAKVTGFPGNPVIVCPDERGAEKLGEYLHHVLGADIIRVPRSVIDYWSQSPREIDEGAEQVWSKDDWCTALISLKSAGVIIMDDFCASGKTLDGLARLSTHFGKSVLCRITLNDLGDISSSSRSPQTYSLYAWRRYRMY